MVKKETEKKKVAEKPVKASKEKPVKERAERVKFVPEHADLETLATELGLKFNRTGHRVTLWTDTGIRVVKIAGGSITLIQPERKSIHPPDLKALKAAIAGVLDAARAKQRHVPVPPKREKKDKSPEAQQKAKIVKKVKETAEEPKPAKKVAAPVKTAAAPPKPAAPVKKPAPKPEK